jgi:hypothetical protein
MMHVFIQSKFLQLLLDERLSKCGRDNIRTPPILHHGQSLRKIASKDERDATKDEVFACLAFDIAEGTVNHLEDLVISHWHLIPYHQTNTAQLLGQLGLHPDITDGGFIYRQWDVELREGCTAVRKQQGGDAGGCYAKHSHAFGTCMQHQHEA